MFDEQYTKCLLGQIHTYLPSMYKYMYRKLKSHQRSSPRFLLSSPPTCDLTRHEMPYTVPPICNNPSRFTHLSIDLTNTSTCDRQSSGYRGHMAGKTYPIHFQSSIQTLTMVRSRVLIGHRKQPMKREEPRTGVVQVSSLVLQHVIKLWITVTLWQRCSRGYLHVYCRRVVRPGIVE